MKRNIMTTIEFIDKQIAINVIEKLDSNIINIFYDSDKIKNANLFIKNSIEKINDIISGKIQDVFVVIQPSNNDQNHIELKSNKVKIFDEVVLQKDIDFLINSTKIKFKEKNKKIILVHPIQFSIEGVFKKKYSQPPINIKGEYISAIFAINYINLKTYEYINSFIKNNNLNICQIFTTNQTISSNYLSTNAINNGSFLFHFGYNHIFFSINKNGAIIKQFNIYDAGFQQLIYNIKESFNCTYQEAKNLVYIYGNLNFKQDEKIIFTNYKGIQEMRYTNQELYKIIEKYFSRIISIIKKYIYQKNIDNLHNIPFIISGKVIKIDNILSFFQNSLSRNITLHNPINFLEINSKNENILGLLNFNNVFQKKLITIIETNPNSFDSFFKKSKNPKTILNKIFNKLGGKYERNI